MTTRTLLLLSGALGAGGAALLLRDQTVDSDDTGEDWSGPLDAPRGSRELGARAVEALQRHVGQRGLGKKGTPGYHRGDFIDRVNRGVHGDAPSLLGAPWCARAVRWAYEEAARELGLPPPFPRALGALSSVSNWRKAAFKSLAAAILEAVVESARGRRGAGRCR